MFQAELVMIQLFKILHSLFKFINIIGFLNQSETVAAVSIYSKLLYSCLNLFNKVL